jgi:ribose transport system substrate-binding protein
MAATLLTALTVSALVAGCGGSSSDSGGGSASTADGNGSADLKAARTASPAQYEGPTEAVDTPAKKLTVGVVTCSSQLSGCVSPANGIATAAKSLGWSARIYDGGGTPQKQNSAMLDAISAGADVIATTAIDPNLVQQGLRAAKKADVLVVSGSNGIDTPNPVSQPDSGKLGYAFDVAPDYAALGEKAAQWIIGDSGGKANLAVFTDPQFPSVVAFERGLREGMKACGGCKVSASQEFNGTQVGTTLGNQTTGYLRSNPDVDYVFSPYDPAAAAQVTAIAQAGMANRVKLVGVLGSQQNLEFIRQGQVQAADAAYDNRYMGYMVVDGILRTLAEEPLFDPHGGNLPGVIIDESNVPEAGQDWLADFDYTSKFTELWKGAAN